MLSHFQLQFPAYFLKRVAEHAMADVMDERSSKGYFLLMILKMTSTILYVLFNYPHQPAGGCKGPDAVGKASVVGTGKNQFRKSELPHAA
jgi:hypothetical protein